jgi:hypothetical protein
MKTRHGWKNYLLLVSMFLNLVSAVQGCTGPSRGKDGRTAEQRHLNDEGAYWFQQSYLLPELKKRRERLRVQRGYSRAFVEAGEIIEYVEKWKP